MRFNLKDFGRYLVRALVLGALLMFAKDCSPVLPAVILPFVFLIYAIPATVGSMFTVVTNRRHKQDLYNESGSLSHLNQRWIIWLGGFFVAYLCSSLLYILQAPSWDARELLLIWVAIIVYYLIYLVMKHICKKEFSIKYYKARAIKWSILITAVLMAIIYAVFAAQPFMDVQVDLQEVIQSRYMPYENSSVALLGELDKLTTYADCLTEYGATRLAGGSYVVWFIVRLILGFSVFGGIISQFGACLLSKREIKSVFQLLPTDKVESDRILKRYAIMLAAIWVVLSGAFLWLNHVAEEERSASEYTAVDNFIEATSALAIIVDDKGVNGVLDSVNRIEAAQAFNESFAKRRREFVESKQPELIERLNAYYDECLDNVDSYVEWYESDVNGALRVIPILGESVMRDEFDKQVISPVDRGPVEDEYASYVDGMKELYVEYWNSEEIASVIQESVAESAEEIANRLSPELALWPSWDSEEGRRVIQEAIMGKGEGVSPDVRERLVELIESQRASSTEFVEGLESRFFPQSS